MTATRLFVYSLISLVVSTCAVAGMFFLGIVHATDPSPEFQWVFPAAGLFALTWIGSAAVAIFSVARMIFEFFKRRRSQPTLG
jgi:hypothetical protein